MNVVEWAMFTLTFAAVVAGLVAAVLLIATILRDWWWYR